MRDGDCKRRACDEKMLLKVEEIEHAQDVESIGWAWRTISSARKKGHVCSVYERELLYSQSAAAFAAAAAGVGMRRLGLQWTAPLLRR